MAIDTTTGSITGPDRFIADSYRPAMGAPASDRTGLDRAIQQDSRTGPAGLDRAIERHSRTGPDRPDRVTGVQGDRTRLAESASGSMAWTGPAGAADRMTHQADGLKRQGDSELDTADTTLHRDMRITYRYATLFLIVVIGSSLYGQVTGAEATWGWALPHALIGLGGLELGGIVVMKFAQVRRRIGERVTFARVLSAAIAATATTINYVTHPHSTDAYFYVALCAMGYIVYLMVAEARRRDRLRLMHRLPAITPSYELWEHWLKHPLVTSRARALARANETLSTYTSYALAEQQLRDEEKRRRITKAIHKRLAASGDKNLAGLAPELYDLDAVADMMAADADHETIARQLVDAIGAARVAASVLDPQKSAAGTTAAERRPQQAGPARQRSGQGTKSAPPTGPVRTAAATGRPGSGSLAGPARPDWTAATAPPVRSDRTRPSRPATGSPDRATTVPNQLRPVRLDDTQPLNPVELESDGTVPLGSANARIRTTLMIIRDRVTAGGHDAHSWEDVSATLSLNEVARVAGMGKDRVRAALKHTDLLSWSEPSQIASARRNAG